jgi:hypothetical protein
MGRKVIFLQAAHYFIWMFLMKRSGPQESDFTAHSRSTSNIQEAQCPGRQAWKTAPAGLLYGEFGKMRAWLREPTLTPA